MAAKNVHHLDARQIGTALAELNSGRASQLADMLAGGFLGERSIEKASKSLAEELGFKPSEPTRGRPRAKMAKMAATADSVGQIHRYGAQAGKVYIPEGCDLSLKCVASGIKSWGAFRNVSGRPHFPPTGGAALV